MERRNSTDDAKKKAFYDFLKQHKLLKDDKEKSDKITHTCFGPPNGSYCISDKELDQFYDLYVEVLTIKEPTSQVVLHVVERPKEIGPFLMDIDFRTKKSTRTYTEDTVRYIVQVINNIIRKYIECSSDDLTSFITEKKEPKYDEKQDNYKDGFHIIYPYMALSINMRYLIIHEVQEYVAGDKGLDAINATNSIDDIFDKSIVERNGWMMYGSKKENGDYYVLRKIYDGECNHVNRKSGNYATADLPKLFSNRQKTDETPMKQNVSMLEFDNKIKMIVEEYRGGNKKKRVVKQDKSNKTDEADDTDDSTMKLTKEAHAKIDKQKSLNHNNDDNLTTAKELCKLLSADRLTNYGTWVQVCWILKNISLELRDTFIEISRKARNFDQGGCEKFWDNTKVYKNGYTVASLHMIAKKDNPDQYIKYIKSQFKDLIGLAKIGQDYDVACILYKMYGAFYKCTSMKFKTWFEFVPEKHKWIKVEGGFTLALRIPGELRDYLNALIGHLFITAAGETGAQKDILTKNAEILSKIANGMGKNAFTNSVMGSCERLFMDPKFEEKLDSNRYLIGFENGVFDLREMVFRDGVPDDYISMTTGYKYKQYSNDHKDVIEIMGFFEKIHRDKDMRDYVLTKLASFLDGEIRRQELDIYTGVGCHARDTNIMMYDSSYKKVQDIAFGDAIMGPDSKPRIVTSSLIHGKGMMYKIIPDPRKANEYIVNEDHILCIKKSSTWMVNNNKVYWHTYEDGKIIEHYEIYKPFCLPQMKNMIHNNVPVEISVKNYINMKNNTVTNDYCGYKEIIEHHNHIYDYGNEYNEAVDNITEKTLMLSIQDKMKILHIIDSKFGMYDYTKQRYILKNINNMLIVELIRSVGIGAYQECDNIIIFGNKLLNIVGFCDNEDPLMFDFDIKSMNYDDYYGFEVNGDRQYIINDNIVTHNSNGKSVTMEIIKETFGEYYAPLPHTVLTRKRGGASNATPELANLKGKRLVVMQEPEGDDKINIGYLKEITGGDVIFARALYKEPFEFKPQFKIIFVCNRLPLIPHADYATFRRLKTVPWESKFIANPDPKKPNEYKIDRSISSKKHTWKSVLMWILLDQYYKKSLDYDNFKEPEKVLEATRKYQEKNDTIMEFIGANYTLTNLPNDKVSLLEIYNRFKQWYAESFPDRCTMSKRDIADYMNAKGFRAETDFVYGIKFKDDPLEQEDDD